MERMMREMMMVATTKGMMMAVMMTTVMRGTTVRPTLDHNLIKAND
jgi:hypothetical protein